MEDINIRLRIRGYYGQDIEVWMNLKVSGYIKDYYMCCHSYRLGVIWFILGAHSLWVRMVINVSDYIVKWVMENKG